MRFNRCTEDSLLANIQNINAVENILYNIFGKFFIGRDITHGREHARQVLTSALIIKDTMRYKISDYSSIILALVAYLHDVVDRKYIPDSTQMEARYHELGQLIDCTTLRRKVLDCIKRSSYTYQVNNNCREMYLDSFEGTQYDKKAISMLNKVIQIVSAADKIYSIGAVGLRRTYDFSFHPSINCGSERDALSRMFIHVSEKLLDLKTYVAPQYVGYLETHYDEMIYELKQLYRLVNSNIEVNKETLIIISIYIKSYATDKEICKLVKHVKAYPQT